jgi:coenzyme F420-dependent glucose-6-phosphate dehydrogenase
MDGGWFVLNAAKLYTRARSRPKMYVSAFGPKAARIAGKYGNGLFTLPDPETAPEVIQTYRDSCAEHGKEEGQIIVQCAAAWAADADANLAGARRWKPATLPDAYLRDLADPNEMQRRANAEVTDREFTDAFIVSADPAEHIDRIRAAQSVGASVVSINVIGSADPLGTIRMYGEHVLPALRSSRDRALR